MAQPLTLTNLRNYALEGNSELRLEAGVNPTIVDSPGSWGKRLVRQLKSWFFQPATRGDQYAGAKEKVLETLKRAYGDDVGTKVFRANIGHSVGTGEHFRHVSSKYHPITGQHIARMIEQGDREILEKYSKPENGGVPLSTRWSTPDRQPILGVPESGTTDWMLRKSVGFPGPSEEAPPRLELRNRIDRRGMNLRAFQVQTQERLDPRTTNFAKRITSEVRENVREMLDDQSTGDQRFWTLDLKLDQGNLTPGTHSIGIRVDRAHPDVVNVFDINHGEVTVPMMELDAWLAAHVKSNYDGIEALLYRAQETMDPVFEQRNGEWGRKGRTDHTDDDLSTEVRNNIGLFDMAPVSVRGVDLVRSFVSDVDRLGEPSVIVGGRSHELTRENAPKLLQSLVHGDVTEEQNRLALLNLSVLINQNLWNSPNDLFKRQLMDTTGSSLLMQRQPLSQTTISRVEDDLGPPRIRIDVKAIVPNTIVGKPGNSSTNPSHDSLVPPSNVRLGYSMEVSLQDLRAPQGYLLFQVEGVTGDFSLIPVLGLESERIRGLTETQTYHDVGLFSGRDGSLVSDVRIGPQTVDGIFSGCGDLTIVALHTNDAFPNGVFLDDDFHDSLGVGGSLSLKPDVDTPPRPLTFDDLQGMTRNIGLSEEGLKNLSRLVSPVTSNVLQEEFVRGLSGHLAPEAFDGQSSRVTLMPVQDEKGQWEIEVEFRRTIPNQLLEEGPDTVLHYFDEEPEGQGVWETVVSLRVPVSEINKGIPQHYNAPHSPRFEWHPVPEQI